MTDILKYISLKVKHKISQTTEAESIKKLS